MIVESLNEMTDGDADFRNDFGQNDRTRARLSLAYDFRTGPGPGSLSRHRLPCRSGSVSGVGNGGEHGHGCDARYVDRPDANPEPRLLAAGGGPDKLLARDDHLPDSLCLNLRASHEVHAGAQGADVVGTGW